MTDSVVTSVTPKPRVAVWDNARFVLIVLVVVAHGISTIRTQTDLGYWTYTFIYLFHMPAFIALAGMFSKAEVTPRAARSTVQLLVTWLTWEVIWALIHFFASGRDLPESWLVSPAWTLWFLVTLATMRILLPYVMQLRHPLVFSVVLALFAGLSPAVGTQFSASRTLCFLPFFVAGYLALHRGWLHGDWFMRPRRSLRFAAVAVLGVIAAAVAVLAPLRREWRIDTWLVWRDDYAWLFDRAPIFGWAPDAWWSTALAGSAVRLGFLVVAAVMILALLVLVPRGQGFFTVWGTRTLYVYLLHGPIISYLRASGLADWFGEFGSAGVLMLFAVGTAITVVLSMTWVTKVFRPVIEPRLDAIFAREPR
ncbi:MAG: acyltransferase family protein [Leucobacter sp.]|nr:acyltransferase family protein [Leucobacter sp.]